MSLCFICKIRPCAKLPSGAESALCGSELCDGEMTTQIAQGLTHAQRIGLMGLKLKASEALLDALLDKVQREWK